MTSSPTRTAETQRLTEMLLRRFHRATPSITPAQYLAFGQGVAAAVSAIGLPLNPGERIGLAAGSSLFAAALVFADAHLRRGRAQALHSILRGHGGPLDELAASAIVDEVLMTLAPFKPPSTPPYSPKSPAVEQAERVKESADQAAAAAEQNGPPAPPGSYPDSPPEPAPTPQAPETP